MAYDLLIHSMSEFESITLPILAAVHAQHVCEIGAEHGGNSQLLYQWLAARNGVLYSVDPAPSDLFLDWVRHVDNVVQHIPLLSLAAIPKLANIDAWFIDGDHNWYTVFHELQAIHALSQQQQKPSLIFMHDVCWPWQQRDLYYAPEQIPADYQHPHTFDLGLTLDASEPVHGGFRSHGQYALALHEGGARNGVLTAIHDFMAAHAGEYELGIIPAVFGLGVLYDRRHPQAAIIADIIKPYHQNSLLKQLERNRLANYLKVIEWQDKFAETESAHHAEVAALHKKLHDLQLFAIEKHVLGLINTLEDEIDHPELWPALGFTSQSDLQDNVSCMRDYLEKLLAIPQDQKVVKLLNILFAMCAAHNTDYPVALHLLNELSIKYSQCSLVAGALFYVNKLQDPLNPKYNLTNKVCKTPFEQMDILENSTHLCCASWLQTSIGNMQTETWQQVWNSDNARKIRGSILEGNYNYCNKILCPLIQGNQLTPKSELRAESAAWREIIDDNKTVLPQGPAVVNLAYDRTCNLSCPSCRPEKFAANTAMREAFASMQEKNILPLLRTAKVAFITGSGDPFASKNFRKLMQAINKTEFPELKLQLMTNAMLLTEKEWEKFSHLNGQVWRIRVSVDAATKATHELLRRGAHWETMLENMHFIGRLHAAGHIEVYELVFVVQTDNFREMGAAVDLAKQVGASGVYFAKISNWGTFSDAAFAEKAVFNPAHPLYREFLQGMQDPRLQSSMVYMPDLVEYLSTQFDSLSTA